MAPLTQPLPCESHSLDLVLPWDLPDRCMQQLVSHSSRGRQPQGPSPALLSLIFGQGAGHDHAATVPSDTTVKGPQRHGSKVPPPAS